MDGISVYYIACNTTNIIYYFLALFRMNHCYMFMYYHVFLEICVHSTRPWMGVSLWYGAASFYRVILRIVGIATWQRLSLISCLFFPFFFYIMFHSMFWADRIVHKSVAFYLAKEETSCKNPSAHEQLKCVTTMFEWITMIAE